jgi:hypothetical protein
MTIVAEIIDDKVAFMYDMDGDEFIFPLVKAEQGVKIGTEYKDGKFTISKPEVPQEINMAQARLALRGAGLLQTVNDTIVNMPGDIGDAVRIEWEFRPTLRRDNILINQLGQTLGLSSEILDNLFIQGSKL